MKKKPLITLHEVISPFRGLEIRLTCTGHAFLESQRDDQGWKRGTESIFIDLLNSTPEVRRGLWEWIEPHQIGALTSSPILGKLVKRDEKGNVTKAKATYWFPAYQVTCEVQELLEKNEVTFTLAD